jgi:hypothetical protein
VVLVRLIKVNALSVELFPVDRRLCAEQLESL